MEYEENNKRKEEGTTTCNFEIFQKMLGVEDFLEQDPYFEEVRPNCKRTSDSGWVPPKRDLTLSLEEVSYTNHWTK